MNNTAAKILKTGDQERSGHSSPTLSHTMGIELITTLDIPVGFCCTFGFGKNMEWGGWQGYVSLLLVRSDLTLSIQAAWPYFYQFTVSNTQTEIPLGAIEGSVYFPMTLLGTTTYSYQQGGADP